MKSSRSGTTIIEAVIAMLIIIVGIIGVYKIYTASQKISTTTENRIRAISIAREGIEIMQNIRDTNWILFGADPENCWNVKDYNASCLGDPSNKIASGNYTIVKNFDNRWLLSGSINGLTYSDSGYRDAYKINLDGDGLYTQSGGTTFNPIFTREINISYIDTDGNFSPNQNDEKMLVQSIVSWADNSKTGFYTVTLENLLTNWKKD